MMPTLRENNYAGFGFLLSVEDGPGPDDSSRVVGGFSEVSGLGMDADLSGYRDGNGNSEKVRKVPGIRNFGVVTLKRGVTGDADLFEWFKAVGKDFAKPRRLRVTMPEATIT